MSQTSYGYALLPAFAGMCNLDDKGGGTGRNNGSVEIAPGSAVVWDGGTGTSDMAIRLPSGATDKFVGVLMSELTHETQTTGLSVGSIGSLCKNGHIHMYTEQAVTPADPVFIRYDIGSATGTSPALGRVRKDADTSKAFAATNCSFAESAAAGALVKVIVNLP